MFSIHKKSRNVLPNPLHEFLALVQELQLGGKNPSGKIAIGIGGYLGLGLEITWELAEAGAIVIVPARIVEQAQEAFSTIPRIEIKKWTSLILIL